MTDQKEIADRPRVIPGRRVPVGNTRAGAEHGEVEDAFWSAMMEPLFMSNPAEAKLLVTPISGCGNCRRAQIAQAIHDGIVEYFTQGGGGDDDGGGGGPPCGSPPCGKGK